MKTLSIGLLLIVPALQAGAQQMAVKKTNFSTFTEDKRLITKTLLERCTPQAKRHPEFGIVPYNSHCSNVVELIDKRTADSRYYLDINNPRRSFTQKSYYPLHYKTSANDVWHTIDKRLRPAQSNSGIYTAPNQPSPTKCDLNRQSTSITAAGFEFEFNRNLSMFFFDDNSLYTQKQSGNYSNYTIGDEGLWVKNMWQGIDMQQVFSEGAVKTNYVISAPLNLPVSSGWMVIEDHFTLPDGYSIVESGGKHNVDDFYPGDYEIVNPQGQTLIKYEKPVYFDSKAYGSHGYYKLLNNGHDYTLQALVPVSWLTSKFNDYPIIIDPFVGTSEIIGNYESSGLPYYQYAFTTKSLGSCDDTMMVPMQRGVVVDTAWVALEYELTYNVNCDSPPETAPFCTFSQVTQHIICNDCGTTSGPLACNPANPPYTGTCSTDSNLITGASPICITSMVPTFMSCIDSVTSCSPYYISFTLTNQDSTCGDVCGFLCARGHMWEMIVMGTADSVVSSIITGSGDTLFSPSPTGNQWYRNDTAMDGDTSAILIITMPGVYFDIIANYDGCANDTSYSITIGNNPPPVYACQAAFWLVPDLGDSGVYTGYNGSSGYNLNYVWYFGDGDSSTQDWPTHVYDSAGYYNVCLKVYNDSCSSTYCDSTFYADKTLGMPMTEIIIQNPAGINNVQLSPVANIYPNPATNVVSIRVSHMHPATINVYDMRGRKVVEQKFEPEIDISNLSPGIYIFEITAPEGNIMRRLVKL